jgi:hypothetical protein
MSSGERHLGSQEGYQCLIESGKIMGRIGSSELTLLDVVLQCKLPRVGVAECHDCTMVSSQPVGTVVTMMETGALLCSQGCRKPVCDRQVKLTSAVQTFGCQAALGIDDKLLLSVE